MALKNRRTQKNKTNRRKQQSKRGGKRIGKNTKKGLRNKRQSRRRMRGGCRLAGNRSYGDEGSCHDCYGKYASIFEDKCWKLVRDKDYKETRTSVGNKFVHGEDRWH